MATNLRLSTEAAEALRHEAARTGRSQQDILREAVESHLGLGKQDRSATDLDALVAAGIARPPRSPFRDVTPSVRLPAGSTSLSLLDREDRL